MSAEVEVRSELLIMIDGEERLMPVGRFGQDKHPLMNFRGSYVKNSSRGGDSHG